MAPNPLILKMQHLFGFENGHVAELEFGPTRPIGLHHDIHGDGGQVSETSLLLNGIACCYKMMGNGRRAIVGFLLPGDFTNLLFADRQKMDFGVAALTPCEVTDVSCSRLKTLCLSNSMLSLALWDSAQIDQAIQRAWLANISQQTGDKRMAHLFCELRQRLAMVGLADAESFYFPITQHVLADALGMSTVHVNRVLHQLMRAGLLRIVDRTYHIPALEQLEAFGMFDAAYLGKPRTRTLPRASGPAPELTMGV